MKTSTLLQSSTLTMESLALPQDLLWDCKSEPTTPPPSELFPITESTTGNWIFDDNFANGITLLTENDLELKAELDLTQDLINCPELVITLNELKEHWDGGKLQIDSEPINYPIEEVIANPTAVTKVHSHFDSNGCSLADLNAAVFTQLTPPHSPPQNGIASSAFYNQPAEIQLDYNEIPQQQHEHSATIHHHPVAAALPIQQNDADPGLSTSILNNSYFNWGIGNIVDANVPEINDEKMSEMLDEFVNKRAKELSEWISQCSDGSSCSALSTSTEEEWMNESSTLSSAGSSPIHQHFGSIVDDQTGSSSASSSDDGNKSASTKKRTRPYGRGIQDRKIRKKEQNKNAATRYRQKKKLEMEVVLTEEQKLEQRNQELKNSLAECKREAKYLRRLIREFYQKKN